MGNIEKNKIIDLLERECPVFIKVNNIQYRIRCPICGDSQKNLDSAHCYVKCGIDPTEPLLFICFLCNSKGVINKSFMQQIGLRGNELDEIEDVVFKKVNKYIGSKAVLDHGDIVMNSPQVKYIESRLKCRFSEADYDRFKIIWNIENLYDITTNASTRNVLPSNHNSISFISEDKSVLLTRQFDDTIGRWNKLRLYNSENRSIYTMKSAIDLFTNDEININIAEGVFDILSIYKHFSKGNDAYIAVLSSNYETGIEYAINTGIFGINRSISVYIDSDIKIQNVKRKLRKYKWLFKSITIYLNIKSKDVGVPINDIELASYIV